MKLFLYMTNLILEHELTPKIEALFDGYKQHTQQIDRVDDKVDEMHKDLNTLTMKALAQQNNLIDLTKKLKA